MVDCKGIGQANKNSDHFGFKKCTFTRNPSSIQSIVFESKRVENFDLNIHKISNKIKDKGSSSGFLYINDKILIYISSNLQ